MQRKAVDVVASGAPLAMVVEGEALVVVVPVFLVAGARPVASAIEHCGRLNGRRTAVLAKPDLVGGFVHVCVVVNAHVGNSI